jgi:hypothetical protein
MASSRRIEVVITGDVKPFSRSMSQASNDAGLFAKHLNVVEKSSHHLREGVALLAGAAGLAGLEESIKGVVEAAQRKQKMDVLERQQLLANHEAYGKLKDGIDATLASQSKLSAFDDEDLKQSFTTLDRVTRNSGSALRLNALAADLARARHMDLQTAAILVGKVAGGNVSILRRYGFQIDKTATSTQALQMLQSRVAGQAEAFGKTNEGAAARMSVAWENVKEAFGTGILKPLTNVENKLADFFNDKATQKALEHYGQVISDGIGAGIVAVISFIGKHRGRHRGAVRRGDEACADGGPRDRARGGRGRALRADARRLGAGAEVGGRRLRRVEARGFSSAISGTVVPALGSMRNTLVGVRVAAALAGEQIGFMGAAGRVAIFSIRAALLSTGIGAAFVGLGLAAGYVMTHWQQTKTFLINMAGALANSWRGALRIIEGLALSAAGLLTTYLTAPVRVMLEAFARLPLGVGAPFKRALDGLNSITLDFLGNGAKMMSQGGSSIGAAFGKAFADSATPYLQGVSDASKAMFRTNGQGYDFTGPSIAPVIAAGANKPGTSINQGVVKFVSQLGGMTGERLTIGTGTNHATHVAGTNRVSDHVTGNAVDIPATGAELLKLGRMALIAAGMDSQEAIKQTGGLFNVNGWQIIFNTNEGGDHYNHLHIGSHDRSVKLPTPGVTDFKLPPMPSLSGLSGVAAPGHAKQKKAPILPYALQAGISRAKSTAGIGDDLKAYGSALATLRGELSRTDDAAKRAKIEAAIAGITASVNRLHDKQTAAKLKAVRDAFKAAFSPQISAAVDAFNRATQRGLDKMRDDLDSKLAAIDLALRDQVDSIDATLRSAEDALDARRKAKTPEEQALEAFKAGRKAQDDAAKEADLRKAVADAQTDDDKKQAQLDLDNFMADRQEEALQQQADASRQALEDQLDLEKRAAEDGADAQKRAAQDAADEKKKAAQDAYDAAVQAYNDERDTQKADPRAAAEGLRDVSRREGRGGEAGAERPERVAGLAPGVRRGSLRRRSVGALDAGRVVRGDCCSSRCWRPGLRRWRPVVLQGQGRPADPDGRRRHRQGRPRRHPRPHRREGLRRGCRAAEGWHEARRRRHPRARQRHLPREEHHDAAARRRAARAAPRPSREVGGDELVPAADWTLEMSFDKSIAGDTHVRPFDVRRHRRLL